MAQLRLHHPLQLKDVESVDPELSFAQLSHQGAQKMLRINGDDSGHDKRLVYFDGETIAIIDGWRMLQRTVPKLRISPAGCQFQLAYGLVPQPYTIFAHVFHLGMGDRMELDLLKKRARLITAFPFFLGGSRQDETPSVQRLRTLLIEAVQARLQPGTEACFMASAGKDSAGLFLALGALGERAANIRAVTYEPGIMESESKGARQLAHRFGIKHLTVHADPVEEHQLLLEFLEGAPCPCSDVALAPYLRAMSALSVKDGVVLDGIGNDIYMGYSRSAKESALLGLSLPKRSPALWGLGEPPDLGARLSYAFKSALMYPAERLLPGSRTAPSVAFQLVPVDTPFATYFRDLERKYGGFNPVDFKGYIRSRTDACGTTLKGDIAALHFGARAVFPYADRALAEYYFHLPVHAQRKGGRSKLLFLKMLTQAMGEQPYFSQKGSFRFDVQRTLSVQGDAIKAEISAADFPSTARWLSFLFPRRHNYVHAYMLYSWFLLAAWINRRPKEERALLNTRTAERMDHVEVIV